MKAIVMHSDERGVFHIEELESLVDIPDGAILDNRVELDGEVIPVYAMPETAVIGRTFALQMWLEDTFKVEVETDDNLNVNDEDLF